MAAELSGDSSRVLYLYGITQTSARNVKKQIGIDGHAGIEVVECGGILCWISRVSAADFRENLTRNMENLDWLSRASVAHQRAISAIARETEVLPARLATVFLNEDSLRHHIRSSLPLLKQDFQRVKGADEWGIKVFALNHPVRSKTEIRSGKDYLKAKAALLPKRQSKSEISGELAEFGEALESVALETAAAGYVSSGQRGLAFQTSLLVKRTDRKKLESVLNKYSKRWAATRRIECTGPWPPYSFVSRVTAEAD